MIGERDLLGLTTALVAFAAAGVGLWREWRRSASGAVNAVSFLWAGVAYFVGLSALSAVFYDRSSLSYPLWVLLGGLVVVCVGVLGVACGTVLPIHSGAGIVRGLRFEPGRWGWLLAALGLGAVALGSRFAAFGTNFLIGGLTTDLPTTWGRYVYDLRHGLLPAGLVTVHLLVSYTWQRWQRWALVAFLCLIAIFSLLQFSRRPFVLLAVGTLVYLLHSGGWRQASRGRYALWLSLTLVVLAAVALLGAAYRWIALQAGLDFRVDLLWLVLQRLSAKAMSLDAYAVMLACVEWFRYPSDWLAGESFLQVVTNPVPRAWWPGKPESFGFVIARLMGDQSTNFGPLAFGEGFANFGYAGSFLFGVLLGAAARMVERWQAAGHGSVVAVLTAMISFEFFPQVRGDLQGMTTPMLERMVLLVGAAWMSAILVTYLVVRDSSLSETREGQGA